MLTHVGFSHSERLVGVLQNVCLAPAMASIAYPIRITRIATVATRRIVFFLKDLPVFASLCLARFIVWRNRRRPATERSWIPSGPDLYGLLRHDGTATGSPVSWRFTTYIVNPTPSLS